MKLLADVDMLLLLLIRCQNSEHRFVSNTMHAQFSSQNSLACPITTSDLIIKVLNGSTLILTNELLKFGYSVGHCEADGPTCVLIVLNGCPTGPKPTPLYPQKLALTSPTSGGRSVGIVLSRTKSTELVSLLLSLMDYLKQKVLIFIFNPPLTNIRS
jgi:hypothetical protein